MHAHHHLPCRSLASTLSSAKQKASYSGEEPGMMLQMLSVSWSKHHGPLSPRMGEGCGLPRASVCADPSGESTPKLCQIYFRPLARSQDVVVHARFCILETVDVHCKNLGEVLRASSLGPCIREAVTNLATLDGTVHAQDGGELWG